VNAPEILRELVAIPTPSAVSNLPLLTWVTRFLESHQWHAERFPYVDDNGTPKANLIARPASTPTLAPIDLAFVCHTDTVPYSTNWTNALNLLSTNGDHLSGCGSCDVKGALACFLAAVHAASADNINPHSALILTADEEIGCKGMNHLLAATNLQIKSAIVSEPTSLRPGIAGKGYGLARVTIHGVEAHSAFPSKGLSAIAIAARFISAIENSTTTNEATDSLFDPLYTTINIGTIAGGTAKNIVSGSCTFLVEWRPIPADAPPTILGKIERIAHAIEAEQPRARIEIESLRAEPGFAPTSSGPLQQRLADIAHQIGVTPQAPTGISFGSEASRLAPIADEVIVIGPGDMHTAHSDRECVPIAELDQWTLMLSALLTSREPNTDPR